MADQHSILGTTFPVVIPDLPELHYGKDEFDIYLKTTLQKTAEKEARVTKDEAPIRGKRIGKDEQEAEAEGNSDFPSTGPKQEQESPFMNALLSTKRVIPTFDHRDGKLLTENGDVAYHTSGAPLVDLLSEAEPAVNSARLRDLLELAWEKNASNTLKIIWNCRSIHLGKASRLKFYRAIGWLAERHPLTLLTNLPWLVRPIISKKASVESTARGAVTGNDKGAESDDEFVMIDEKTQPEDLSQKVYADHSNEFDVKYGVAHGYWKDLLNLLALAVNDQLNDNTDPKAVLNVARQRQKNRTPGSVEDRRRRTADRHSNVLKKLEQNGFYKALHLVVARLFSEQLRADSTRLGSENKAQKRQISLAAKWAPSNKGMHDQHTCIVSSIAEALYPPETVCPEIDPSDRELYLKHARQAYQQQTLSPLRKHIAIVERPITTETFEDIHYDRVPSLAMHRYTPLFIRKDHARFDEYTSKVAEGSAQISGATLLPSNLKIHELKTRVVNGQWETLVRRIKDAGKLENSIAVCDVSGSMSATRPFPDGTHPIDAAIGLSLLVAEITQPPFGGAIITFSRHPTVVRVGGPEDQRSFTQKVEALLHSGFNLNTDFAAVFEKLVLPMALENHVKPEDMVKRVFVFSDMQFDAADNEDDRWSTSYERIRKKFEDAGYDLPELVFWNLAASLSFSSSHTSVAPKPVTSDTEGTALLSGYGPGMLKMFMGEGEGDEADDDKETTVETKDEVGLETAGKGERHNPMSPVERAISHKAYSMLKVVD